MKLQCISGANKGRSWEIEPPKMTIGRDEECDIVLEDVKISRVHAELVFEESQLVFRDRESTNGSKLNAEPVQSKFLKPGDVLTLGSIELVILEEQNNDINWDETRPSYNLPQEP